MPVKKNKLTMKQNLFVCEYLSNGYNASAAARAAGYSKKSARVVGTENLTKPAIVAAIDARIDVRAEKLEHQYDVTEERILKEMATLAFSNSEDYINGDGTLKQINQLTREQASAIGEFKVDHGGRHSYKLYDKRSMLDMLAKYKKLYNQDDEAGKSKHADVPTVIILPSNGR